MARPGFFMDGSANESGKVDLYLQWTSGTTGAVASIQRQSGFGSGAAAAVALTGTGLYTVQFDQAWFEPYLAFDYSIKQTTYSAAGACVVQILGDSLMATTGVMTIEVTNAAGAAVASTTGDVFRLNFCMQSQKSGY